MPDDTAGVRAKVVHRRNRRGWGNSWTRREVICQECAGSGSGYSPDQLVRFYSPTLASALEFSCATCRLPVLLAPDLRRTIATCSDKCRNAHYATNRASVVVAVTHVCAECGAEMRGRADKKHCSPACRQRAYRARA